MPAKSRQYQYELDIYRIIGALGIVLFHYGFRGNAAGIANMDFPALAGVGKYGYCGIYLFLILSGYTVTLTSLNKTFGEFVISRITRLYPLWWIAVSITALLTVCWGGQIYSVNLKQYFWNMTMLSGFINVKSIDGVYWFVYVIVKFYMIFSLVLLLKRPHLLKILAPVWLLIAFVTFYFKIPKLGFFVLPEHACYIIAGIYLCYIRKEGWSGYNAIMLILAFLNSLYVAISYGTKMQGIYHTTFSLYIITAIVVLIFLLFLVSSIKEFHYRNHNVLKLLGAATFALYLLHQRIGFMVFSKYGSAENKGILLAGLIVAMIVAALLLVRFAEPFIRNRLTIALSRISKRNKN